MIRLQTKAVVCALRSHGEHGAIVRLMTPGDGLQAAYVRGARGRRMRPVLIAGNVVQAAISARTDTQLPQATIELIHSRGPILSEPLPAAAIEWVTVRVEVSPFVILFSVFMIYPLGRSIVLSFYQTAGPERQRLVGSDRAEHQPDVLGRG